MKIHWEEANGFSPLLPTFYWMPRVYFKELHYQELWVNVKSKGKKMPKILGFNNSSGRCLRLITILPRSDIWASTFTSSPSLIRRIGMKWDHGPCSGVVISNTFKLKNRSWKAKLYNIFWSNDVFWNIDTFVYMFIWSQI